MRKALVVGIDYYEHGSALHGCVNDAYSVKTVLERNSDGTRNFDVLLKAAFNDDTAITKRELRDAIIELFEHQGEAALLYYAGHGHLESIGGHLITSDAECGDEGVSLNEILAWANKSKASNKIIILDSCHSGITGQKNATEVNVELSDGMTILTASTAEQYANEVDGGGVFTNLLVDALNGAAGNLVGEVTPGSVYAHIDQSLGSWEQRPVFRTNVKQFISLRKVQPPIALSDLQRLTEFFPEPGHHFHLDPDYEPDSKNPDPNKTAVFAILQKYNRVNLVTPVDEQHMYYAAMNGKSCKLTVLGEHYRRLVEKKRI